jgi:acetylglutamate kinase
MKLVIKIGGEALEEISRRRQLARQVGELHRRGHRIILVHGGGKMLTRTLANLNIPTKFVKGLRVTDAATRDVALMVLAGAINKQLVAALEESRVPALGLCGGDAALIRARKVQSRNASKSASKGQSLGFVGRPSKVNSRILEIAFREGMVPVVASLALGAKGEYLNVNADDFAAALAIAVKADRLLYLTESGGVWDAERRLLPLIKIGDIPGLIQQGVVRDGMIPKLRSCARTLRHVVGEIDILPADAPGILTEAVENRASTGTRIVQDRAQHSARIN